MLTYFLVNKVLNMDVIKLINVVCGSQESDPVPCFSNISFLSLIDYVIYRFYT